MHHLAHRNEITKNESVKGKQSRNIRLIKTDQIYSRNTNAKDKQ